jgi:hypothetical protein
MLTDVNGTSGVDIAPAGRVNGLSEIAPRRHSNPCHVSVSKLTCSFAA